MAPLLEELIFRAGLRSPDWTLFAMPTLVALFDGPWQAPLVLGGATAVVYLLDAMRLERLPPDARTALRWRRGRAFIRHYPLLGSAWR